MAKESMKARQRKREHAVKTYAAKRAALKEAGDYEGLQKLYSKYAENGLEILGFPCNQFKGQEPGSNEEIQFFCTEKYDVSFNIFNKIDVNGPNTDPFYDFLKNEQSGVLGTKNIKWNFSKFLVNKNGEVIKRYSPTTKPEDIESDIENLLS